MPLTATWLFPLAQPRAVSGKSSSEDMTVSENAENGPVRIQDGQQRRRNAERDKSRKVPSAEL